MSKSRCVILGGTVHRALRVISGAVVSLGLVTAGWGVTPNTDYIMLSWNDLGMHCMNRDHAKFSVLPPFNNAYAQVIRRGDPTRLPQLIVGPEATVEYSIPGNTYSVGKTDFWTWCDELFGVVLPPNIGLTGKGLTGVLDPHTDHYRAEGIPLTPYPDATPTTEDPYQQAYLLAKNASGEVIATSTPVLPVSTELRCLNCHSSEQSILNQHEDVSGFDPQATPILCASCHASPALGTTGDPEANYFSFVMHKTHEFIDEDMPGIQGCYQCHPGVNAQCLRDTMNNDFGMICQDCHGSMNTVSNSIEHQGRIPWLNEPACRDCHTAQYGEPVGQLYRQSTGHGGVMCSGCHNSPHAILPSREARDNANVIALQGHSGTLSDCTVCHGYLPAGAGPHGLLATAAEVEQEVLQTSERLQIAPNPMTSSAAVFVPPGPGPEGKVVVFDVRGRTVAVVRPHILGNGSLRTDWNGMGRGGKRVSPGTYFLRWDNGLRSASGKVLVVR